MNNKTLLLSLAASVLISFAACKKEETTEDEKETTTEAFMASSTPENRKVVLEDFTGVRCGYCPDGAVRAKAIADANPGKVIIVAVHSGSYALPASGWANFTNDVSTAINKEAFPLGYPAGTVNRIKFTEYLQTSGSTTSKLAMGRGSWAAAADKVFAMSSPVNVGAKATYDAATKKLTVKVDMYYTSDESASNSLNVFLLQSNLISNQSGGGSAYSQQHVLRASLTGNFGEAITESKVTGSKVTKTFTYDVPADYNGTGVTGGGAVVIDDLKVVAFVSRDKVDILNGVEVDVK